MQNSILHMVCVLVSVCACVCGKH